MLSCRFLHATERKRMKGTIDETAFYWSNTYKTGAINRLPTRMM